MGISASMTDAYLLTVIADMDKPLIPDVVTMRQARLALLQAGLLSQVTAAIESLPSPQKEAVQIEWEYSQTVDRGRPFTVLLGSALGLDEQALDLIFIQAASL
tara:strand:- start:138 stop:446 length:309 start_codon:yes stop_codon:yes gene_type:complete